MLQSMSCYIEGISPKKAAREQTGKRSIHGSRSDSDPFPARGMYAREPLKRQSATEPISYSQNNAVRSDSLSVCQHRLTLFSSARLRLSLARAGAGKQSEMHAFIAGAKML